MTTRRDFLRRASMGLAAAGASGWVLRAGAGPTQSSGGLGSYGSYRDEPATPAAQKRATRTDWAPTEDNILGPFYRKGAPFRAKVTPPLEAGKVLLVTGRVWGHDTRKPLVGAVLDVWQANAVGRYDNDDQDHPPAEGVFVNRARLVTDEQGYYEFETIHPGAYKTGPDTWRPSHIHYWVRQPDYQELVTQLYFKGDPRNEADAFIKQSLIIELKERKLAAGVYEYGNFDIVLAKGQTR